MEATAKAGSNIAIVKYWGARDLREHLPANDSISLTLDGATTLTHVRFSPGLRHDSFVLNGSPADDATLARVVALLDRMRALAGVTWRAELWSQNSFPAAAGLASSASGFAALTVAAAAALGLELPESRLSALARLGSGSACRSIIGGWAEWLAGDPEGDSYAVQIAPAEHWDVRDVIAVVSEAHKAVSSSEGHRLAPTSPFFTARLAEVEHRLAAARRAIRARDFAALGETAEADTFSMHSIMMTSRPPLLYWLPATLELMRAIWAWRQEGMPCYFTIDAGPNVHILTLPEAVTEIRKRLEQMPCVERMIVCGPGPGPQVVKAPV